MTHFMTSSAQFFFFSWPLYVRDPAGRTLPGRPSHQDAADEGVRDMTCMTSNVLAIDVRGPPLPRELVWALGAFVRAP